MVYTCDKQFCPKERGRRGGGGGKRSASLSGGAKNRGSIFFSVDLPIYFLEIPEDFEPIRGEDV